MNDYVIGQDTAKKTLAVAVFNHYNRVRSNLIYQHELQQQETENLDYHDTKPHAEHHNATLPTEYYTTNTPIQTINPDLVPAERMSYGKCK